MDKLNPIHWDAKYMDGVDIISEKEVTYQCYSTIFSSNYIYYELHMNWKMIFVMGKTIIFCKVWSVNLNMKGFFLFLCSLMHLGLKLVGDK